ncbi:hypothetical protein MAR_030624 [Mya arenaria]|uniref:ZSWIM1/3 RNaseH-like domain-containing protein n=1 Tax=Mya arenaria TaxID=6604 RepID=A0ABY7F2S8_MYAAR|nr:hypothetical protein MAR_030624 [Mya arenaria]
MSSKLVLVLQLSLTPKTSVNVTENETHGSYTKGGKRFLAQPTKQLDCPVKIDIRHSKPKPIFMVTLALNIHTIVPSDNQAKRLRVEICDGSAAPKKGFTFTLPCASDHANHTVGAVEHKFMFVYQSSNMKYLLNRYGNQVTMLDSTYKTSKYTTSLFFLCVKTNTDTQVVATFIDEDEQSSTIAEALSVVQAANINWKPKYFITDQAESEITALNGN